VTIERTLLQERLINIVRRFPQQKVLVVGDAIADQFVFGAISRVSREAPVFILKHEYTETVPGGAANCAVNVASLGASASLVSTTAPDEAGRALLQKLDASRIDRSGVLSSDGLRTTTKVRILAGQLHSTRQQVIRIDYDTEQLNEPDLRKNLREQVLQQIRSATAVIVSDYNYGVADTEMALFVRDAALANGLPVLADSRFRLASFAGFTSATPNQDEVEQLVGRLISGRAEIETAADELRAALGYRALLVTRGSQGLMLLENGVEALHVAAVGASEPLDVTGAGDTVIATYTLALASGASFSDAARLANYAGGLVVMKRGTASISSEELENSITESEQA